jgi:hypothetical protein
MLQTCVLLLLQIVHCSTEGVIIYGGYFCEHEGIEQCRGQTLTWL